MSDLSPEKRVEAIRAAFPREGLFAGKTWRLSPEPFPLSSAFVRELQRLGRLLHRFLFACNSLYLRSASRRIPAWVAELLDAGKPDWLIEHGRARANRRALPQVLRPDIILTDEGFIITELDNVPGGIGLTAWLNETYSRLGGRYPIVGGSTGMLAGFRRILPKGGDILVSDESADYRPEMTYLARRLNEVFFYEGTIWRALKADNYPAAHYREIYRFFELFDVSNIVGAKVLSQQAVDGVAKVTPPYKPFLEEKLWMALFHHHLLRDLWIRALRRSNFDYLRRLIPYSWIMEPIDLPRGGVLPRLEVNSWDAVKAFKKSERSLVLKVSGFSDLSWGSRGVTVGSDASHETWSRAIDEALAAYPQRPSILQRFHKGRRVVHPYFDESSGQIKMMEGRARLCPYYLPDENGAPSLQGVLATIVPADKKIIHGMTEAILAPCHVVDD